MPNLKRDAPSRSHLDHEQLMSLINSMTDGVIAIDAQGKVIVYNGAALNILDRNDSIEGKLVKNLLKLTDKNGQPVDAIGLIEDAKTPMARRDLRLAYGDGSIINLYFNITPVHRGYGSKGSNGYVLVLRDITKEKSLEEERDEFISVVSHELRTPIAIAEGNISNAQFISNKASSPPDVQKALKEAHNQILFLAALINDLATLSRAERGKLTVDLESINAHELVKDLVKSYEAQAQQKGLELKYELDPRLELLESSKLYVREILENFMTNSIKYTESGSVTLSAKPRTGGVEFKVTDTGIGISKSDQERVFDKFFRSEDFRTRKTNGTGLGLYVTMKLARLLHADISVESQLNHGSTFTIFIPDLLEQHQAQAAS